MVACWVTVVPEREVVCLPAVPHLEFGPSHMLEQKFQERVTPALGQLIDARCEARH